MLCHGKLLRNLRKLSLRTVQLLLCVRVSVVQLLYVCHVLCLEEFLKVVDFGSDALQRFDKFVVR